MACAEPRARILFADDEQVNRLVLRRAIERGGFDAVETSTGAEAVLAFQKHRKENGGFLCVLMDINMPEMDGLEAAWKIRQLEAPCERCKAREPAMAEEALNMACQECYRVPIWAVSACSDKDQALSPVVHHLQGSLHEGPLWRQAGMDDFMPKPVNVLQLQHKLAKLHRDLRRSRSGDNLNADSGLRIELAKSGSLSRSWSDLDMWKQPAVGACIANETEEFPPGLAMEDSAEGLCLLGKSLEPPYVPEQASRPPDCRVK